MIPGRGCSVGVVGNVCYLSAGGLRSKKTVVKLKSLESGAVEGESPVGVSHSLRECFPK